MKLYVNIENAGVRKVYTFPQDDVTRWHKRDIVADFVATPAGLVAYNAFKTGLHYQPDVSLWDYQTGQCLVGTLAQLDAPR